MNNKPFIVSKNDAESLAQSNTYNIEQLWKQVTKLKSTVFDMSKSFNIEDKLTNILENNKRKVYTLVTEDYIVDYYVDVILFDTTAGDIEVQLRQSVYSDGKVLILKKIDASVNSVTITPFDVEQIDGESSLEITTNDAIHILATSVGWIVIN
jgi:hypothetical protein